MFLSIFLTVLIKEEVLRKYILIRRGFVAPFSSEKSWLDQRQTTKYRSALEKKKRKEKTAEIRDRKREQEAKNRTKRASGYSSRSQPRIFGERFITPKGHRDFSTRRCFQYCRFAFEST